AAIPIRGNGVARAIHHSIDFEDLTTREECQGDGPDGHPLLGQLQGERCVWGLVWSKQVHVSASFLYGHHAVFGECLKIVREAIAGGWLAMLGAPCLHGRPAAWGRELLGQQWG